LEYRGKVVIKRFGSTPLKQELKYFHNFYGLFVDELDKDVL